MVDMRGLLLRVSTEAESTHVLVAWLTAINAIKRKVSLFTPLLSSLVCCLHGSGVIAVQRGIKIVADSQLVDEEGKPPQKSGADLMPSLVRCLCGHSHAHSYQYPHNSGSSRRTPILRSAAAVAVTAAHLKLTV